MQKNVVLISLPLDDLETLIIDSVNACLKGQEQNQIERTKPEEANPNDLLTKKEAAKLLSCSTSTIDNYARAGVLTRNYVGRSVRFSRSDVLAIVSPSQTKRR